MVYRPRIPDNVHERVEVYTLGERIRENELYISSIKLAFNESGEKRDWIRRVCLYCDKYDKDEVEVLNHILAKVLEDDGEPNIQFKERLRMNDI